MQAACFYMWQFLVIVLLDIPYKILFAFAQIYKQILLPFFRCQHNAKYLKFLFQVQFLYGFIL